MVEQTAPDQSAQGAIRRRMAPQCNKTKKKEQRLGRQVTTHASRPEGLASFLLNVIPSGVPPTLFENNVGLRTYAALLNNKSKQ